MGSWLTPLNAEICGPPPGPAPVRKLAPTYLCSEPTRSPPVNVGAYAAKLPMNWMLIGVAVLASAELLPMGDTMAWAGECGYPKTKL